MKFTFTGQRTITKSKFKHIIYCEDIETAKDKFKQKYPNYDWKEINIE